MKKTKRFMAGILAAAVTLSISGAALAESVTVDYYGNPAFRVSGVTSLNDKPTFKDIYGNNGNGYYCTAPVTVEVLAGDVSEIGASQLVSIGDKLDLASRYSDSSTNYEGSSEKGAAFSIASPGIYWISSLDSELSGSAETYAFISGNVAPTSSKVYIDGKETEFLAYNIGGNNYFKLRDVAMALNGSQKQYNVSWDAEKGAISLSKETAYEPVGGELEIGSAGEKTATPNISNTYLNGELCGFISYTIDGNNYYMLRGLGKTFDFAVEWNSETNSIHIDTSKSYTK